MSDKKKPNLTRTADPPDELVAPPVPVLTGTDLTRPLTPRQPPAEGEIRFRTSLPVATREEKMRVYRAQISQDRVLRDMLGQTMQVRDWITHDWTGVDDTTGEVRAGIRSVLVLEDGQLIAAVSDGIVACLHALIGWAGPAPWSPPLSLKCVEHRSSRSPDRRYYLLEPV